MHTALIFSFKLSALHTHSESLNWVLALHPSLLLPPMILLPFKVQAPTFSARESNSGSVFL